MIKKAVRLTESDLNRLVNKVIKEQAKFEFDPKDLEIPDVDKLRDMFLSNDASPEVEKMGGDFKKAMNSCVSERNLYKVGGLLKNIETKKSNILNTIVAMLFDSKNSMNLVIVSIKKLVVKWMVYSSNLKYHHLHQKNTT
jgi:hypothetical protein